MERGRLVTVHELIEALEKQDPEDQVVFGHARCGERVRLVYRTMVRPERVVITR